MRLVCKPDEQTRLSFWDHKTCMVGITWWTGCVSMFHVAIRGGEYTAKKILVSFNSSRKCLFSFIMELMDHHRTHFPSFPSYYIDHKRSLVTEDREVQIKMTGRRGKERKDQGHGCAMLEFCVPHISIPSRGKIVQNFLLACEKHRTTKEAKA